VLLSIKGVPELVKIIVLIKDIPDLTEMKIDPATRRPLLEHAKRRISDVDKRALEAAIHLKEKNGGEVLTLSLGDDRTKTTILEALAMGADASHIVNDKALLGLDTLATSTVLASALNKLEPFDMILCGEMTLDTLSSQVGPRLAELLNLPQVIYVKRLEINGRTLRAERDLGSVDEVVEVDLPAVVSVIREVNEPRIPSLMNIMKAKKKPIVELNAQSLGLSVENIRALSSIEILRVEAPIVERKHVILKGETLEEAAQKLARAILAEGLLEA